MSRTDQRLAEELGRLPRGLQEHIERVRQEAKLLARRYGVDLELADRAAVAHDLARALSSEELFSLARRYGVEIGPVEKFLPVLLHGPVAEQLLREWGEEHPQVLEAVRWHTTAQRGMSDLAKLVFLADKLDPAKERRYSFLEQVRRLSEESLDAALLEFLSQELMSHFRDQGVIHPASLEARNELLMGRR